MTDAIVGSNAVNQFTVRASSGLTFFTDAGLTTWVTVGAGGGSWASVSDRNAKENFAEVDGQALLARLNEIPIETWNYKTQDDSIRHLGPMAQDFRAAFGLGSDDKRISTVDADGVALAAIQALYRMSLQKDERIRELMRELKELRALVAQVSRRAAIREESGQVTCLCSVSLPAQAGFGGQACFGPRSQTFKGGGGEVLESFDPAPLDSARGEQGKPSREGTGVILVLVTLQ